LNLRVLLAFVFAAPALAFVCGTSHGPVIVNCLGTTATIRFSYSDGTSFKGNFPPGATIWAPSEGLTLTQLEATYEQLDTPKTVQATETPTRETEMSVLILPEGVIGESKLAASCP